MTNKQICKRMIQTFDNLIEDHNKSFYSFTDAFLGRSSRCAQYVKNIYCDRYGDYDRITWIYYNMFIEALLLNESATRLKPNGHNGYYRSFKVYGYGIVIVHVNKNYIETFYNKNNKNIVKTVKLGEDDYKTSCIDEVLDKYDGLKCIINDGNFNNIYKKVFRTHEEQEVKISSSRM